jgi:uncharacterized membrane protein (UPF0182 family)
VAMRPPLPVPSISRRAKIIIGVVVLMVIVLSVLGSLVRLYVDWLWFGEIGYRQVFSTGLRTRLFLFLLFGVLMAVVVGGNLALAYRLRPPFRPMSMEQQNLERYRTAIEPRRRLIGIVTSVVLGIFVGLTAQAKWETWLLWRQGVRFNVNDPQFGWDISYFVFTYPFQRFVLGILFTAVLLSLFGALAVHYLFGGLRLQTPGEKVTPAARVHLSVLLGLFVLLKAGAYVLDRYGLVFSDRGGITGASYTDVNAVLPAKTILVIVALICSAAVFANIVLRNLQLPAIALILLVLTSIVTSGIYPALVQQFSVKANADQKEKAYIARNIAATRQAYGIASVKEGGTVEYTQYKAQVDTKAVAPALKADTATIPNARLLDPNVLSPTFTQFEQIRNVYGFADQLDIDRYTINGKTQDYVVGARELVSADLTGNQQNWINRHLVYTHGNGFVAAAANQDIRGEGDFTEGDIPPAGPIPIKQSGIYYGERITDYSIVGSRPDEPPREFDRPSGAGDEKSTYAGRGGVRVGGVLRKLAFSIYYRERNILLSGAINNSSRIIFVRDPADRVQKAAPFLKIDGDPYPAVVDGRIYWIIDGYTTLNGYPYSQHETLGEVTADSLAGPQGDRRLANQQVNYIRNSVKATVDAYDGTVTLYEWDSNDPLLKTWERVYPKVVQPRSAISPALMSHFRYPEDLFKVQRDLLTKYHVDDPVAFFNTQDFWAVPDDPTVASSGDQPPYYIMAKAPGQERPTFQLTSALNALNRDNLSAYVTVSSDVDSYGKIRVLQLPGNQAVLGPKQVFGKFNSNAEISRTRTLLDQGGSHVVFGNLLTLPVAGGLLYVEPLYVEATSAPYPLLQKILVAFGNDVAIGDTLQQALDNLFGPGAGQRAPDQTEEGTTTPTPTSPGGTTTAPPTGGAGVPPDLAVAVREIDQAIADLKAAYRSGDFAQIGAAQEALQRAVARFEQARNSTPSGRSTPAPTGTPTPGPSP